MTTRTPEHSWSAVNTTRFLRPPSGPTDGPVFDTWYRICEFDDLADLGGHRG